MVAHYYQVLHRPQGRYWVAWAPCLLGVLLADSVVRSAQWVVLALMGCRACQVVLVSVPPLLLVVAEEVSEAGAAGRAAIPFLPVLVAALVLVVLVVLVELVLARFRQQPYLQVPGVVADLAG